MISKIPPKEEWNKLSINQLNEVRSKMMDTWYNMRLVNATFAGQYMSFIGELDNLIKHKNGEVV